MAQASPAWRGLLACADSQAMLVTCPWLPATAGHTTPPAAGLAWRLPAVPLRMGALGYDPVCFCARSV